jgi:integrase
MLFDRRGRRKYLTPEERNRFIRTALDQPAQVRAFCITIAMTGCRISEALQLTWGQIDGSAGEIIVRSLKKRREDVYRSIPIPTTVLAVVRRAAENATVLPDQRIWPWCRATGWKRIKEVLAAAGVVGSHASPKGLRHGFAIAAVQSGVPLNLVQRWLGHADIATTAIYASAVGEEERLLAQRMWRTTPF